MSSSRFQVVVVGRMNVGKSTLFNRLSTTVKSLTLDYPGVTRDFVRDTVEWQGHEFDLIDSGGISLHKTEDSILEKVRLLGMKLIEESDVVVLVVDGSVGPLSEEIEIAQMLQKKQKRVVLAINKADKKVFAEHEYEFARFGFQKVVAISAQHGTGIGELLDFIVGSFPSQRKQVAEESLFRVMFLGKPNVGKSSLMNALVQEERALVSPIAGTTREAVSQEIKFYQENIMLIDTPGVRRKRKVDEELESMMVSSTMTALKDADIVILMLDGSKPAIVDQELKLAFYAFTDQYKGLVLLINKSDLMTEESKASLEHSFEPYNHLLKKIPVMEISCTTGKNIGRILPLVKEVWHRYSQQLEPHAHLSFVLKSALTKKPLYRNGVPLQIYKVKQIKSSPVTIGIHANEPAWFGPSQRAYLENVLRAEFDLVGVPVKFVIRGDSKSFS